MIVFIFVSNGPIQLSERDVQQNEPVTRCTRDDVHAQCRYMHSPTIRTVDEPSSRATSVANHPKTLHWLSGGKVLFVLI